MVEMESGQTTVGRYDVGMKGRIRCDSDSQCRPGSTPDGVDTWLTLKAAIQAKKAWRVARDDERDSRRGFTCSPEEVVNISLSSSCIGICDVSDKPPILDYGYHRSGSNRFSMVGFTTGLLCAVVMNVLPYLMTRGAYLTDGYETAGFPLPFYRRGGFLGECHVYVGAILVDAAASLAMSVIGWFIGILLSRPFHARWKRCS